MNKIIYNIIFFIFCTIILVIHTSMSYSEVGSQKILYLDGIKNKLGMNVKGM